MTTGKIYQKKQEEIQGKDLAVIREAREDIVSTRTDTWCWDMNNNGRHSHSARHLTMPRKKRRRRCGVNVSRVWDERNEKRHTEYALIKARYMGRRELVTYFAVLAQRMSWCACCPLGSHLGRMAFFPLAFMNPSAAWWKIVDQRGKKEKLVWIEYAWLEAMSESPFCQSTNNVTDLVYNYLGWRYKTLIRRAHKRCDWLTLWLPPGLGVTGS